MTGLHREKQGVQHPETDSSVEGGVYGALTFLGALFSTSAFWPASLFVVCVMRIKCLLKYERYV